MQDDIRSIITQDNPDLLVSLSEEIGKDLGYAKAMQINSIYHTIENEIKRILNYKNGEKAISSIAFIKPILANLISRSSQNQKPALERFYYNVVEGIGCVLEAEGKEITERLKRFRKFIEVVVCYYQYTKNQGISSHRNPEIISLRNKLNALHIEQNNLLQFIAASTKETKVFISHSHDDKKFVKDLIENLEEQGINTWYDNKDMDIGDVINDAITEGIKQSWCFLIVVSHNSIKSGWVKNELDEAYHQHISEGKRILPVIIGNVSDNDIPQVLKKHLYADFRETDNYEKAFEVLCRAIIREGGKNLEKNEFNKMP